MRLGLKDATTHSEYLIQMTERNAHRARVEAVRIRNVY